METDVSKVLSKAVERADDRSRADFSELVRTSKMRELVISHDARILSRLGIPGPADCLDFPMSQGARSRRRQRAGGGNPIGGVIVKHVKHCDPLTVPPELPMTVLAVWMTGYEPS